MDNRLETTNSRLAIADASNRPVNMNYVTDINVRTSSARESYYRWLSRFVILIAILSLLFFSSASLVLFKLAPEVHIEPFLIIKQDSSEDMVRYETISRDMPSANQMMELFIRQYVILRNTVINDEREMQSRWFAGGMLSYLSSIEVFEEFFNTMEKEKHMEQNAKAKLSREVEIISVGKVGGNRSPVWKVDFKTYELSPFERNETTNEILTV